MTSKKMKLWLWARLGGNRVKSEVAIIESESDAKRDGCGKNFATKWPSYKVGKQLTAVSFRTKISPNILKFKPSIKPTAESSEGHRWKPSFSHSKWQVAFIKIPFFWLPKLRLNLCVTCDPRWLKEMTTNLRPSRFVFRTSLVVIYDCWNTVLVRINFRHYQERKQVNNSTLMTNCLGWKLKNKGTSKINCRQNYFNSVHWYHGSPTNRLFVYKHCLARSLDGTLCGG